MTAQEAWAEMQAVQYLPLEDYPGQLSKLWRVLCLKCGQKRRPSLYRVRIDGECKCRVRYEGDAAILAEVRALGFEPLAPYPGGSARPWVVRCVKCGQERTSTMVRLRSDRCVCKRRRFVSVAACVEEMRAAGFEPEGRYSGRVDAPWAARCTACGESRSPTLHDVRRGHRCRCRRTGRYRLTHVEAVKEVRSYGYAPVGTYPGSVRAPWAALCRTCGQSVEVTLTLLRVGQGCGHKPGAGG